MAWKLTVNHGAYNLVITADKMYTAIQLAEQLDTLSRQDLFSLALHREIDFSVTDSKGNKHERTAKLEEIG